MQRVGDILGECVDPSLPANAAKPASSERGPRFFDGSYGIGLLSSRPLEDDDRLELEAAHHPRAVLHARLQVGARPLQVFCTHLTPIIGHVPHPEGGSSSDGQAQQVDAWLARVEKMVGSEPALVLGDLNTGSAA